MDQSAYELVRNELKTGDLLLFSGKGLTSWAIKRATISRWSHVGLVYKIDDEDLVLCFESTTLNKFKSGVQISLLRNRALAYNGEIWYRSLSKPITAEQRRIFFKVRKNLQGVPYERNILELALSAIGGHFIGGSGDKSLFCSELVALTLMEMGILYDKRPASSYAPVHFSTDCELRTHEKYGWGEEKCIKE